jgi:hypothetical protein
MAARLRPMSAASARSNFTAPGISVVMQVTRGKQVALTPRQSFDEGPDESFGGPTMTFDEVLGQVLELLQQEKRVSYRGRISVRRTK